MVPVQLLANGLAANGLAGWAGWADLTVIFIFIKDMWPEAISDVQFGEPIHFEKKILGCIFRVELPPRAHLKRGDDLRGTLRAERVSPDRQGSEGPVLA